MEEEEDYHKKEKRKKKGLKGGWRLWAGFTLAPGLLTLPLPLLPSHSLFDFKLNESLFMTFNGLNGVEGKTMWGSPLFFSMYHGPEMEEREACVCEAHKGKPNQRVFEAHSLFCHHDDVVDHHHGLF